jgi:DNA-binding beta-propeller fold protein YncE
LPGSGVLLWEKDKKEGRVKKLFTGSGWLVLIFALGWTVSAAAWAAGPLRQVRTIALPGVAGRIDHFSADVRGRRLFVSALGNHTVEVVDLAAGKWLRRLSGVEKPQGECYVDRLGKLFTADGTAGNVKVYGGGDLRLLATVALDLGPDAEAYDPATRRLYVGYGGEDAGKSYGEVGIIDAVSNRHVGDIRTSAHPGAVLVGRPGHTLYVTVPKTQEILQIDLPTGRTIASWKSKEGSPVALAYDALRERLFVGTRNPAQVEVFAEPSHRWIASLPSVGLMDGLFYDAKHRRVYASGGDGYVSVYRQSSADRYEDLAKVPTGANARTSLWVPGLDHFYVVVPAATDRGAEVLDFQPAP